MCLLIVRFTILTGECKIIEASKYLADGVKLDPLQYVTDNKLLQLLPSAAFLSEHNSDSSFMNGVRLFAVLCYVV